MEKSKIVHDVKSVKQGIDFLIQIIETSYDLFEKQDMREEICGSLTSYIRRLERIEKYIIDKNK